MNAQLNRAGAVDPQHPPHGGARHEHQESNDNKCTLPRLAAVGMERDHPPAHVCEKRTRGGQTAGKSHSNGGHSCCTSSLDPSQDRNKNQGSVAADLAKQGTQSKPHPHQVNETRTSDDAEKNDESHPHFLPLPLP